jgi:hypothetical protein
MENTGVSSTPSSNPTLQYRSIPSSAILNKKNNRHSKRMAWESLTNYNNKSKKTSLVPSEISLRCNPFPSRAVSTRVTSSRATMQRVGAGQLIAVRKARATDTGKRKKLKKRRNSSSRRRPFIKKMTSLNFDP